MRPIVLSRNNIPIAEIPALLHMEAHAGIFGVMFSMLWFSVMALTIPLSQATYWIFVLIIAIAFFIITWISIFVANLFMRRVLELSTEISISDGSANSDKIRHDATMYIATIAGIYTIVLSVLIWITGGINSPFVFFYLTMSAILF